MSVPDSTMPPEPPPPSSGRWYGLVLMAGLYLTLRGYHAFDGDQAYRLPLLLHQQYPDLFARDPFVRAFDAFNPHRGYLALLDAASRPLGLAVGLAGLFALTLAATMLGVDRLARAVWSDRQGGAVGLVAVGLILLAKGGNIGTNHLFEGTLLDRLIAFALGWQAIAALVIDPKRGLLVAMLALGLAALIHPSVGLQLGLTLTLAFYIMGGVVGMRPAFPVLRDGVIVIGLISALVPSLLLNAGQAGRLLVGMPLDEFRHWAVEVQGPQHMLPATWRMPQWLAFGCYPVLAALAWGGRDRGPDRSVAGTRFGWLLVVNLASLGAAYVAVVWVQDLRVTIFQPFRMATLARGLCLVALAGRLVALWERGGATNRARGIVLAVGLIGDWSLVVVTLAELVGSVVAAVPVARRWSAVGWAVTLGLGLVFLARHDTEGGHRVLGLALGTWAVGEIIALIRPLRWNRRRRAWALGVAWAVPGLAILAGLGGARFVAEHPLALALVDRCRFAEIPTDDLERVARWCRDHTSVASRFVGPPGEKGFRFWSERSLAFNRAGSPYHAAGLRDWSDRFRDHVGWTGTPEAFARAYLDGRHRLEANYGRMSPAAKLALARRQGADYVLEHLDRADAPSPDLGPGLMLVSRLGIYAVYRVIPIKAASAPPRTEPH